MHGVQAKGRKAQTEDFLCARMQDSSDDEDFTEVRCPDMTQAQRDGLSKRLASVRLQRMKVGASGSVNLGALEDSEEDATALEDSDDDPEYLPEKEHAAATTSVPEAQQKTTYNDSEDEECGAPPLPPSVAALLDDAPTFDDDATCIPDTIRWDETPPTLPPHQQCCAHLLNNVLASDVEKCLAVLGNSHEDVDDGAAKAKAYQTGIKKLQAVWRLKAKSTLVSVVFSKYACSPTFSSFRNCFVIELFMSTLPLHYLC